MGEHWRDFQIDAQLGVATIFVSAPRRHLTYVKVVVESYEGLGVARSEEPFYEGDRALLVLLLVPDFFEAAAAMLAHLEESVDLRPESITFDRIESLRRELLD